MPQRMTEKLEPVKVGQSRRIFRWFVFNNLRISVQMCEIWIWDIWKFSISPNNTQCDWSAFIRCLDVLYGHAIPKISIDSGKLRAMLHAAVWHFLKFGILPGPERRINAFEHNHHRKTPSTDRLWQALISPSDIVAHQNRISRESTWSYSLISDPARELLRVAGTPFVLDKLVFFRNIHVHTVKH